MAIGESIKMTGMFTRTIRPWQRSALSQANDALEVAPKKTMAVAMVLNTLRIFLVGRLFKMKRRQPSV